MALDLLGLFRRTGSSPQHSAERDDMNSVRAEELIKELLGSAECALQSLSGPAAVLV